MGDDRGPTVSRRAVLAAGAATLAPAAGCALGDAGATDDPDPGESGSVFSYPLRSPPETVQFNPWLSRFPRAVRPLFYAYRSVYHRDEGRQLGHVVESVDLDGRTATVHYAEGYRWWNGEPVTARDDYVHRRLADLIADHRDETGPRATDSSGPDFDVVLTDETELIYEFADSLNPRLVREVVAEGVVTTPAWLFEEWVDRLAAASTADERGAIVSEFRDRTIPFQEFVDEGLGCGPFEPTALLEPRVECELFDGHPDAGEVAVDRVHLPVARDDRERQLLVQGETDAGQRRLVDLGSAVPSSVEQLDTYRIHSGVKLLCNWRGPLADRRVRWAIAAAVPLDDLAANSQLGEPVRHQTGMGTPADGQWLSESTRDRLYDHPTAAAPEAAATHLRAAGFRRSNGTWHDADGEPVAFRLQTPTLETWTSAARTVAESLRSLGVEVRTTATEFGTFFSNVTGGAYDLALWWNAGRPFHVYDVTSPALDRLGYALADADREESPHGKPVTPRVPGRVTGPDADDADPLDLRAQWRALRTAPTDARVREAVAPFARWWNFDLPDVQLVDDVVAIWGNTRDYVWPAAGDPALRTYGPSTRPELHALVTGAVERRR